MTNKTTRLTFVSLFLFSIVHTSNAHDYWIFPDHFSIAKGDLLSAELLVGDQLTSELSRNLIKERTKNYTLVNTEGTVNLLKEFSEGSQPIFSHKMNVEGLNLIAIERKYHRTEMTDKQFTSYIEHENMPDIMALRKNLDKKDIDYRRYARSIKSLIKVGTKFDGNLYKKVLGHTNEIILLDNPYKLKAGDIMRVKLIDRGNPLAGRTITAFNGNGDKLLSTQKMVTNADGIASFKVDKTGFWMVRSSHLWHCPECKDVNWEGYISSYSFSLN